MGMSVDGLKIPRDMTPLDQKRRRGFNGLRRERIQGLIKGVLF